MVDSFTKQVRNGIELLYSDRATVIGFQTSKDSTTKETFKRECVLIEDMPCRLSFKTPSVSAQDAPAARAQQQITLFCPPDREVPIGSHVEVLRCGKTFQFEASGIPALYGSHQEVALIRKDYA